MSLHYDYQIGMHSTQVKQLDKASTALYGLVAIREHVSNELERPDWWSDYYESVLTAAMSIASTALVGIEEDIREQAMIQDEEASHD